MKQLEVQLEKETAGRLEELARSTGRSETFLAELAINRFVEAAQWEIEAIKEGIAAADRGEVVEQAEVTAWIESLDTDRPLPRPKPRHA